MNSIIENKPLFFALTSVYSLVISLSLNISKELNEYFQLTIFPAIFIQKFFLILIMNTILIILYEKIVSYLFK
jgi:hypothetical protein